jgi:hypothetical protein
VTVFCLTSADFCFPPPLMCLWVEPAGGEQKSADIERQMVMLIYPYPSLMTLEASFTIVMFTVLATVLFRFEADVINLVS